MKRDTIAGWILGIFGAAGMLGYLGYQLRLSTPGAPARVVAETRARQIVSSWPQEQRLLAEALIERYGPPDVKARSYLRWEGPKPWKRVVVRRSEFGGALEQTVAVSLSDRDSERLAAFGHGLSVDPGALELSARGDSESLNLLTLNLAYQVIQGWLSPAQARAEFDKAIVSWQAGKEPPYMVRLTFTPLPERTPRWTIRMLPLPR